MKNTFSFNRLWALIVTELSLNWRRMTMWMLVLGTILVVTIGIIVYTESGLIQPKDTPAELARLAADEANRPYDPIHSVEAAFFSIALFLSCCFAATMSTRSLQSRRTRTSDLTLPALQSEKFLAKWIIYVPLFMLALCLLFQLIDYGRVCIEYATFHLHTRIHPISIWYYIQPIFKIEGKIYINHALAFAVYAQSIYMLGAYLWPKSPILKTTISLIIIALVIIVVAIITEAIIGTSIYWGQLIEDFFSSAWFGVAVLVASIFNYIIAYFRYRELEILDRW